MEELVELITCKRCGQQKPVGKTPGWCDDCERAYNNRYSYLRKRQPQWMDIAKDSCLELYERQPGETQLEWSIWLAYRDSYPGAKPNLRRVAEKVNTTLNFAHDTSARWNFQARMQAWITECDRITMAQRRQEVLDMNKDHIDMAARLRKKLSVAIDNIDPLMLEPKDINGLMKTATELERKAQLDQAARESAPVDGFVDHENPDLKKSPTKQEDLGEVVSILLKAGVLGDVAQVGLRTTKTETTEVVMRDSDGNEVRHESATD